MVRLIIKEQSVPVLHCLFCAVGSSHRLYAYAHGILFLRVLGSGDPGQNNPRGAV